MAKLGDLRAYVTMGSEEYFYEVGSPREAFDLVISLGRTKESCYGIGLVVCLDEGVPDPRNWSEWHSPDCSTLEDFVRVGAFEE